MKRLLCICIDCYKLFTYVEHRTMKYLLRICIDCYLYVEHRFLIVVNFDMHCLYLMLLKKLKRIHVSEFFGRVPYQRIRIGLDTDMRIRIRVT